MPVYNQKTDKRRYAENKRHSQSKTRDKMQISDNKHDETLGEDARRKIEKKRSR